MNKIRRNFRQIYAEGCDVLGGGGGMMLQAQPPPVPCDGSLGEECKRYLFFFPAECEESLPDQMFNFKTNGGKTIKGSQLEKSTFPIS